MTMQRNDNHSTEFGLWLRQQREIDSSLGFVCTNIDFMWRDSMKGDKWLLIEEKRFGFSPRPWQMICFRILENAALNDQKFYGFHLLQFERTSPSDGWMKLNGKEICPAELFKLLRFELPKDYCIANDFFHKEHQ